MINPIDLCLLSDVKTWLDMLPSGVRSTQIVAGGVGYTTISINAVSVDGNGTGATFTGVLSGGVLIGITKTNAGRDYTVAPLLVLTGDGAGAQAVCYINDDVLLGGLAPTIAVPVPPPSLITRVSAVCLALMNRKTMLPTSVTEMRNGNGAGSICPYYYPILTVASVGINGRASPPASGPGQTGWVNDSVQIYLSGGGTFPVGFQNIALAYQYGWTIIPYEMNQTAIELVCQKYKRRQHIDQDSQTLSGQIINFSRNDIPPEVKQMILQYKIKANIE